MIRILVFLIAPAVFLIAAVASAAPIFPPLVLGEYAFGVRTAVVEVDPEGIPLRAPSRSIAVFNVLDPGALLLCVPAGPDGTITRVAVTVTALGDRAELRAVAFPEPECVGLRSERCDDGAYVFFTPPAKPVLELAP